MSRKDMQKWKNRTIKQKSEWKRRENTMKKLRRLMIRVGTAFAAAMLIILSVLGSLNITAKAGGSIIYEDHPITVVESISYTEVFQGGSAAASWSTHRYLYDNRNVYCIESNKAAPADGTIYPASYIGDCRQQDPESYMDLSVLAAAIAHGPSGKLYYAGLSWWRTCGVTGIPLGNDYEAERSMYVITHVAANYAFAAMSSNDPSVYYQGVPQEYWKYFDRYIEFLAKVANGDTTFPDPEHDPGTNGGIATSWKNIKVRIIVPGEATGLQAMAMYVDAEWKPVYPGIRIKIPVIKTTDNPGSASLEGAVYGLYDANGNLLQSVTLHQRGTIDPTAVVYGEFDTNVCPGGGTSWDDDNPYQNDAYYIQEITAPSGFKLDTEKHWFFFYRNTPNGIKRFVSDDPIFDKAGDPDGYDYNSGTVPMTVTVIDEFEEFKPDIVVLKYGGKESVAGAEYTMYRYVSATDESQNPAVAKAVIDTSIDGTNVQMSGKFDISFTDGDVGNWYYIKETKVPTSGKYGMDNSRFWFRFVKENGKFKLLPYENQSAALVNGSVVTVWDKSVLITSCETENLEFRVDIVKTGDSEDPMATLNGTVYTIFNEAGTKIKDVVLKVDASNSHKASGSSGVLTGPAGTYYLKETTNPHGYKLDGTKHIFTVNANGTISSASPVIRVNGTVVSASVTDVKIEKPFRPEIQIIKNGNCNVEDEKADVSKAKYGLFDSDDNLLQEITLTGTKTQGRGKFTYMMRKPGDYYVKETYSPEYFDLDETKYTFRVSLVDDEMVSTHSGFKVDATDKSKATVTVNEKPNKYEWNIKVIKTAETEGDYTSLNDVVYGLFKEDGTELQRVNLIGNNKGATGIFQQVFTDKAEAGNYYVQEIETAKGFRLNPKKYPFEVNVEKQSLVPTSDEISVAGNEITVNAVDESEKGKFTFVKRGEDGLAIEGAIFEVYLKSGLSFDNEAGDYNWDSVKPCQILTSNAKGTVLSEELNLGTYLVRETAVSEEYLLMDPFEVVIEKDLITVDLGEKTDRNIPVRIRCTKKDSGRDTVILKAGTTYEMKNGAGENVADRNGNIRFVCDDSGVILIDADLSPDTYTITEVTPPDGYRDDSEPVVVRVDAKLDYVTENGIHIHDVEFKNTEKLGDITVTKSGKTLTKYENEKFVWEDSPLPGAIFDVHAAEDIYSPDNSGTLLHKKDEVVGTILTGNDGTATIENLHLGKYYLVESVSPAGYLLDRTPVYVELSDEDSHSAKVIKTATKYDDKQNVVLDLYKYDAETKMPVEGAKFGIYADEDIRNFEGKIIVKSGEILAYAKSGKDGKISFDLDLPFNKYMVKEEQTVWGYVLNKTEYRFDATAPESTEKTVTYKNEWGNAPVRGNVTFVKTGEALSDFKDGKFIYEAQSLKGAEFDVYANEVYTYDHAVDKNGNRTAYYKKDQKIEHIVTDENGTAKITNYPIGTYYLVETKAPYGMTIQEKRIDFEIKYKDQNTPVVLSKESIVNERQKITLTIGKLQRTSNVPLSGGVFDLYAKEDIRNYAGKVIVARDTKIASASAKDGIVDFGMDLPHAEYYVKESKEIGNHYENTEIYQLDGRYSNSEIKNLGMDLVIYNDKIPGIGRLMLKVAGKTFEKKKNNYITGDKPGDTGYSVLIGEEEDIAENKIVSRLPVVIFGVLLLLIGVGGFVLIKKGRKIVFKK
ncbi:MAG: hypothetical protein IKO32_01620 [Lachnospiraceae bacterium]|nr:hypothetical protein [Lachnospiraceae bacterium]